RTRRARDRHVLRGRALPLHHGGRDDHGVPRRPPLLVAEDHRPHVYGVDRQGLRRARVPRVQPDVLPAVHPRLPRHAAPLPRVSGGISGPERPLDRGRVDPGRGLPAAAALLHLVDAVRGDRVRQPLGGDGPGMADHVTPSDGELRPHARGHRRALRLPATRRTTIHPSEACCPWLTPPPPTPSTSRTRSTTPTT